MYEALVKRLRTHNGWALNKTLDEAADAIEELIGFVQEAERDRDEYRERLDKANDTMENLEAALILMVLQYCSDDDGTLYHQFMSAGERAFDALGITLETNQQVLWDRLEKIEAEEGE